MPNKIMKTLTIGNTKYTIQDTRVDSLENELDDKLDAPTSAGTNGQVLTLNSSGDPVWQNPPTELPSVTSSDNGKMLTVTNGAWAKGDVPTELPSVSSSDNGKILKVTSGAWAKGDAPTELPSVTSSDNDKILKVTNGAWAKGDAPSGLPSVTASDNGKMLTVANGVWAKGDIPTELPSVTASDNNNVLTVKNGSWTKGKVGWNQLESSVYQNITNHSLQIQSINEIIYRNIEPSDGSDDITYIKGTMSADGTINTAGNGIISSIIREPGYIWAGTDEGMCIALYDVNDTYIGKINENFEIDTDPSTGWYNAWDYNGNYPPENNNNIFGIRLLIFDITSATITNNSDAQTFGETTFGISYTNRATYKYVDNKLDDKLDKPVTAGTTGQVLSLNSNGDTVWQNASGGLPSVTSSDNEKVLKVTNGAWAKGNVLPSVSSIDDGKVLQVYNGSWSKSNINLNNLSGRISDYEHLIVREIDTSVPEEMPQWVNGITYIKGTMSADGTIDPTGNGIISSIIREPIGMFYTNNYSIRLACYDINNNYVGKINENFELDMDPLTNWYETDSWSSSDFSIIPYGGSYTDPNFIRGIRLIIHQPIDISITDDIFAQVTAERCITPPKFIIRAPYDYVDILKQRIERLENLSSPKQIQQICAMGLAPQYFNIGDIIYMEWTDHQYDPDPPVTYQYPFVVTHFGTVYDENDVAHNNAMYLMAMYATPYQVPFDAPEEVRAIPWSEDGDPFDTTTFNYYTKQANGSFVSANVTNGANVPDSPAYYKFRKNVTQAHNRMQYGYNRYQESAVRQWLNSDAPKGTSWWTAQHNCDVAPSQATTVPGWLNGFSQEWLDIFKPVRIKTWNYDWADTVYDKFFIPSVEQVYGVASSGSTDEGEYWEYWKNITELNSPADGSMSNPIAGRQILPINDLTFEHLPDNTFAYAVGLRSNSRGSNYTKSKINVSIDTGGGYIVEEYCKQASNQIPCCVIY